MSIHETVFEINFTLDMCSTLDICNFTLDICSDHTYWSINSLARLSLY